MRFATPTQSQSTLCELVLAQLHKVGALRGLKPGEYGITFGVDAKRGLVAAKAVRADTPNAMPVRRTDHKQLAIHLGAVFLKHPELRPVTTSECLVSIRKDRKGEPCLMTKGSTTVLPFVMR